MLGMKKMDITLPHLKGQNHASDTPAIPNSTSTRAKRSRKLLRLMLVLSFGLFFLRYWSGRNGNEIFTGELHSQQMRAAGVAHWIEDNQGKNNYFTGNGLIEGEWLFGTYLMSGLGLVQSAWEHPELRERHTALVRLAVEKLLSPEVRAFDTQEWNEDAIETLAEGTNGHAAYLGYLNLLLACQKMIDPESPASALHDQISDALERRLRASPIGLLQTYPGECYPVDNAPGIASLALRDRFRQGSVRPRIQLWLDRYLTSWRDRVSGLLYQAVNSQTGNPEDKPRGSGTSLSVYFLSFADSSISTQLHQAALKELSAGGLGFTAMREYRRGVDGKGDVDSGPLLLGLSISSTGFSLAGCRQQGDLEGFISRWRLVHLLGIPARTFDGQSHFVMGGRLGDAILFAMTTAVSPALLNQQFPVHP